MHGIKWVVKKQIRQAAVTLSAALALAGTGIAIPGQALAVAKSPGITQRPAISGCYSVTVLGARGSGQTSGGPFRGYGPQVYKAISIIGGYLRAKKVNYTTGTIEYPAASVSVLAPSKLDFIDWTDYLKNHVDKFSSSVGTGATHAVRLAEIIHAFCPQEKLVLVGYSQGAMVMHDAEIQLETKSRGTFNAIIGTVLIGDGNRMPNTSAHEFGSSPASGEGLEPWIFSVLHLGNPFKDVPLPAATANICNNDDLVCDTRLYDLVHYGYSASVHTESYANCNASNQCTYYPALVNGATWVARIVASKV